MAGGHIAGQHVHRDQATLSLIEVDIERVPAIVVHNAWCLQLHISHVGNAAFTE